MLKVVSPILIYMALAPQYALSEMDQILASSVSLQIAAGSAPCLKCQEFTCALGVPSSYSALEQTNALKHLLSEQPWHLPADRS